MKHLRLLFTAMILSATQTTDAQVVSVFLSEGSVTINEDASIAGPTSLLLYPVDAFQFSEYAQGFFAGGRWRDSMGGLVQSQHH